VTSTFVEHDLRLYGPAAGVTATPTLAQARHYCQQLASSHYENFAVASWLLPSVLRPHFHAIYAYCRWSDDLADEVRSDAESLALLDWWESELQACYTGSATHPVFVALRDTIAQYSIPIEPFANLLTAFRQDQNRKRYETFNELLGYCENSANPVGRLVLYLGRCHTPETVALSDSICTGLQLANFWQDVARDYAIGRVYLPQAECRAKGYTEEMFARQEYNAAFRELLGEQVDRAEAMLRAGEPLVGLVPRELRIDIALFIRGGLAILDSIRQIDYNVWQQRPTVGRWQKFKLLLSAWWQSRR